MAKEQMYRINSLPGIKKCIDYMRKAKSNNAQNNSKPKVKKEY
tara:strand:+ start:1323 stop:1451 length:129 start_codon:yes stop_codon:yes gene_type:complete